MNAVGIGIPKDKSIIAVMCPFKEIGNSPFEISQTGSELNELSKTFKILLDKTHVIMEYTALIYPAMSHHDISYAYSSMTFPHPVRVAIVLPNAFRIIFTVPITRHTDIRFAKLHCYTFFRVSIAEQHQQTPLSWQP